jgi:DNA invertase Pin-like site-specific DNA recombinase
VLEKRKERRKEGRKKGRKEGRERERKRKGRKERKKKERKKERKERKSSCASTGCQEFTMCHHQVSWACGIFPWGMRTIPPAVPGIMTSPW